MTQLERERNEAEGQGTRPGPTDADTRAQDNAGEAKARAHETASHLASAARSKGAQVAGQAGRLGHKARAVAADTEHPTVPRAVAPLLAAAGFAVAVAGWVSRRRRKQRGILRRVTRKR